MLRNLQELTNFTISATDGEIGRVKDCYFQDDAWVVRYFVVDTGSWLASRQVLVSPISVHEPDWHARTLPASITMAQVRDSPDIDTDQPVSRQNESQYLGHYGYPNYWDGVGLWGEGLYPDALAPEPPAPRVGRAERERALEAYLSDQRARHRNDDPHLRSARSVTGYRMRALNGDIGHVAGFLADDQTWAIRYLIVDTRNWWIGHDVLVAPTWITGVDWAEQSVAVDLQREAIELAPTYDPAMPWGREQDLRLYRHYGRSSAWVLAEAPPAAPAAP